MNGRAIGAFYDKGLFYRSDTTNEYKCISGPARNALQPYLSEALQEKLIPIESEKVCFKSIIS